MSQPFFDQPILNSPYSMPRRHWELDEHGQPTQNIVESRRKASFVTPIPNPKKKKRAQVQTSIVFDDGLGLSTEKQQYDPKSVINAIRAQVDDWRNLADVAQWRVSPETARLLQHWRSSDFTGVRPFFCQVEAVETVIWLTEVAQHSASGRQLVANLEAASRAANPLLSRLALKLATGAGKTTVMAMLIAWQTVNAVRRPTSPRFTRGFLLCTPGITIRDRLQVLRPNDPNNYYTTRNLVPVDMIDDIRKAIVVITNYHAFQKRERASISKGGKRLLQGWEGEELLTLETDGQMVQRVAPELMGLRRIAVFNDEAHHCYRERPPEDSDELVDADNRGEAEKNNAAARVWISGLEIFQAKLGVGRVFDLSATPFFLSGSGYAEGTLFPWTASDFSLMDAIECGIVKLPRVPVAENIVGSEMPMFRDLWQHIRTDMPKAGRSRSAKKAELDPLMLPAPLQTAMQALYGHYEKTFALWEAAGIGVPPCFIVVCQNTTISKLVYDYVSGFVRMGPEGAPILSNGRLALFRNYDEQGEPLPRPNTILVDSEQLEADGALDPKFREYAADEIERFKAQMIERTGDRKAAETITEQALLREVLNTVGKPDELGANVRCVVSVAMLTEGWDANTVTHVLGIRAFGTQLLCEQVIGRALRRQSYELGADGLFPVEYADVFGIPFDFTAKPVVAPPQAPATMTHVYAVSPDRDALEIRFPRVDGYRVELPSQRIEAKFTDDSRLVLTPELVGPTITENSGIIGESESMTIEHLDQIRQSTLVMAISKRLIETKLRSDDGPPNYGRMGEVMPIVRRWLDDCLSCQGNTYPGLLCIQQLCDDACEKIMAGITQHFLEERPVRAMLSPYNPTGSTRTLSFRTSKTEPLLWRPRPDRCHLNFLVLDSGWEGEMCRVIESHPHVLAYVKNHALGFEVPYRMGGSMRHYRPDFIVLVDDGHGATDPLHLVVETKGYRGEDARFKADTMATYWVPGVNHIGTHGRWAFAEFTSVYEIQSDFEKLVAALRS